MTSLHTELFTWGDKYSVGLADIDAQHKNLVAMLNALHKAMHSGDGATVLGKLLESLIQYTDEHFSYEEGVMRRAGYKGMAAHIQEHRKLTAQVHDLRDKFRAGRITVSMQLLTFLKDWLQHHILGSDVTFAQTVLR
jgi:hemerythrin-like metal-binding protein